MIRDMISAVQMKWACEVIAKGSHQKTDDKCVEHCLGCVIDKRLEKGRERMVRMVEGIERLKGMELNKVRTEFDQLQAVRFELQQQILT